MNDYFDCYFDENDFGRKPHVFIKSWEDVPQNYDEIVEYNATSTGDFLDSNNDEWDDLYCSIQCELKTLDRVTWSWVHKIRACGSHADSEYLMGHYRKFKDFQERVDRLNWFMHMSLKTEDNYPDFEWIYEEILRMKNATFKDLMAGEQYNVYHNGEYVGTYSFC